MKTCEEMVNSLLRRAEQYETQKRRERKRIACIAAPVFCVCLLAFAGLGIFRGKETPTPTDPIQGSIQDPVSTAPTEPQLPVSLVIHPIDRLSGDAYSLFCLHTEDLVNMDGQALNRYYGAELFGNAPAGWKEEPGQWGGIYRRDTGEIYWDINSVTYTGEDPTRSFGVMAGKECKSCLNLFDFISGGERSRIGDTEVAIGQTPEGSYQAEFLRRDAAFRVVAKGFTQEEFISVLTQLLS